MITEKGAACLGDFGITGIITDPAVVERNVVTTSKPGVTRYMAPELLDPPQFGSKHSNPSRESDVYSFAMTAYEVPYSSILWLVLLMNAPSPCTRSSRETCRMVCGRRVLPPTALCQATGHLAR